MEAVTHGEVDRDEFVTISETAAETGGSTMYLQDGSEWQIQDLFSAMALASANDATVALAEHLAGSEAAFVDRMNKKAEELGLSTHANFVNSHGLPLDGRGTESTLTAEDTALLGFYLLQHFPEVVELTKQPFFSLSFTNERFINTNQLLEREDDWNEDGEWPDDSFLMEVGMQEWMVENRLYESGRICIYWYRRT
ncbi:D-alanyl-D-alanine carboxypeptidase [Geomicrobium sp. JCM 19039]|nr:D-alanyl-D-alanine carboxypeptidase [Geomicrobium sp. JCM 19039]